MLTAVLVVVSLVGGAAGAGSVTTNNKCSKDTQWTYILEYNDDRTKDDIPDKGIDVVPGFNLENAYWIGSEALKRFDITETQLCFQNNETCEEYCEPFGLNEPGISRNGWYTSTSVSGGIELNDDFAWDQPTRHKRFLASVAGSGDMSRSTQGTLSGDGVPANYDVPHCYGVMVHPKLASWTECGIKSNPHRNWWAKFLCPIDGGGFSSWGGYWSANRGSLSDPLWEVGWSNRRDDCSAKVNVFQIRVKGTPNGVPNPGLGSGVLTTTLPPPLSSSPTANTCGRNPDWSYILDYHDDNNRDDIPNDADEIVRGMNTKNAFFIGNEKLEEWDIDRISLCVVQSSTCEKSCVEIPTDTSFPRSCLEGQSLTTPLKSFVASMSGQCNSWPGPGNFAEGMSGFPEWFLSQPNSNVNDYKIYYSGSGWRVGGTGGVTPVTLRSRGMSLAGNYEFNEIFHYDVHSLVNPMDGNPSLTEEDKWDSFQIRVKGTPPSTSTETATSTSSTTATATSTSSTSVTTTSSSTATATSTTSATTTTSSTQMLFVDKSPGPCFLAGFVVGLVVFIRQPQ